MNEDQILSEYIDGELPPDVVRKLELRLQQDSAFRQRLSALQHLTKMVRAPANKATDTMALDAMSARVWQKMEHRIATGAQLKSSWFTEFRQTMSRTIALPIPALAAVVVVVLALGIFLVARSPATGPEFAIAGGSRTGFPTGFGSEEPLSLPSTQSAAVSAQGDFPALRMSDEGFGNLSGLGESSTPLEVTIEVQNLRQLLSLLENSKGISQVSIQLPRAQKLQPMGEAMLLKASELIPTVTTLIKGTEAVKP